MAEVTKVARTPRRATAGRSHAIICGEKDRVRWLWKLEITIEMVTIYIVELLEGIRSLLWLLLEKCVIQKVTEIIFSDLNRLG